MAVTYTAPDGAHTTHLRVVWPNRAAAERHAGDLREMAGVSNVLVGEE